MPQLPFSLVCVNSGRSRLSELVQEVGGQLVFSGLQFFFGHAHLVCDGDIKSILLRLHDVKGEEVNNFRGVLPGPSSQNSWSIDSLRDGEVVQQGVEVLVRKTTHDSPESAHLQLGLVVHLADQLLAVLQFHLEFELLLAKQIRTLLHKSGK